MKNETKPAAARYSNWIADLKKRWRATQIKAAVAVNSALIEFYWNLGRDIAEDFADEARYGSRFFEKVSRDMRGDFPGDTGFSTRNIRYCLDFFRLYSESSILPQLVAKSDRRGKTNPNGEKKHDPFESLIAAFADRVRALETFIGGVGDIP